MGEGGIARGHPEVIEDVINILGLREGKDPDSTIPDIATT
jgi:hypothetical protein